MDMNISFHHDLLKKSEMDGNGSLIENRADLMQGLKKIPSVRNAAAKRFLFTYETAAAKTPLENFTLQLAR